MIPARLLMVIGLGWGSMVSAAPLTVIHDSGDTLPIAPWLAAVSAEVPPEPAPPTEPPPFTAQALLPIRTPELQPGPLKDPALAAATRERLQSLPVPLFIIGSDSLSLDWLRRHRSRLLALGAIGLLIQADTEADLAAVAQAGQGLPIAPLPGSSLTALGLTGYPVLLSRRGVEQ